MKFRGIDLNLLVTVDALLDEAHVGRAAGRLGLSQPAASNALARARALFDDPLLVRSPSDGRRRTPLAEAMRGSLQAALAELAGIVGPTPPELARLRGVVRLVASDVSWPPWCTCPGFADSSASTARGSLNGHLPGTGPAAWHAARAPHHHASAVAAGPRGWPSAADAGPAGSLRAAALLATVVCLPSRGSAPESHVPAHGRGGRRRR